MKFSISILFFICSISAVFSCGPTLCKKDKFDFCEKKAWLEAKHEAFLEKLDKIYEKKMLLKEKIAAAKQMHHCLKCGSFLPCQPPVPKPPVCPTFQYLPPAPAPACGCPKTCGCASYNAGNFWYN